jgi:hypothetical protein
MFKVIFFLILVLSVPVLIVWALVDIMKSEFVGNNKIAWVLVVIFLPMLGSLLYMGIGQSQKV